MDMGVLAGYSSSTRQGVRAALRAARRRRGRVVRAARLARRLAHGPCRLPATARPTRPGN